MKNVHGETDHLRIDRLSKTVQEVLQPDPKSLKKSLDCTECGICFVTREDQVEHNRNNHEQKVDNMQKNTELKFACNLCDKPFDSKGSMVNHRILVHTVRTKDIYCDFCDEIFTSKKDLCSHISTKHSEYFALQDKSLINENIKSYDPEEKQEEGEVEEDKIIIEEEIGSYKFESWGGNGEEKEGFAFKGKKKEFAQATLEVQRLFLPTKNMR